MKFSHDYLKNIIQEELNEIMAGKRPPATPAKPHQVKKQPIRENKQPKPATVKILPFAKFEI